MEAKRCYANVKETFLKKTKTLVEKWVKDGHKKVARDEAEVVNEYVQGLIAGAGETGWKPV